MVNEEYKKYIGIYCPNSKKGGFDKLCGSNYKVVKTPPKEYGAKSIKNS